jgi:RNA polymerase sigma factor (sigma-70 family)
MEPAALFRANLALIERVIAGVCRRAHLRNADAEDFASAAKLALIDDDYAILRKWEERSSLAGYLMVVIRRLLANQRDHELGRWRPSAEATKLGPVGVQVETLLYRDGRTFDEVVPIVRASHPELSRGDLLAIAQRLPHRTDRPRPIPFETAGEIYIPSSERADLRVVEDDIRRTSDRASRVVRATLAAWPDEDVMILRFRFGSSMSIADISRMLRLPQRPLYRRIDILLATLRQSLTEAGLDASALCSLIGHASQEMNFGLTDGKNGPVHPSLESDPAKASEEWS